MPRPRSEAARRSVLDAMRAAVVAGAYEAVTIEGLAETAGVAKQTIYRWWPSKAAILGEALLEGDLPGADVEVPITDDVRADLHAWFAAMSAGLGSPEGTALARALIAVTATDHELGLALNGWRVRSGRGSRSASPADSRRARSDRTWTPTPSPISSSRWRRTRRSLASRSATAASTRRSRGCSAASRPDSIQNTSFLQERPGAWLGPVHAVAEVRLREAIERQMWILR